MLNHHSVRLLLQTSEVDVGDFETYCCRKRSLRKFLIVSMHQGHKSLSIKIDESYEQYH